MAPNDPNVYNKKATGKDKRCECGRQETFNSDTKVLSITMVPEGTVEAVTGAVRPSSTPLCDVHSSPVLQMVDLRQTQGHCVSKVTKTAMEKRGLPGSKAHDPPLFLSALPLDQDWKTPATGGSPSPKGCRSIIFCLGDVGRRQPNLNCPISPCYKEKKDELPRAETP